MKLERFFTPTVSAGNLVTAAALLASAIYSYGDLRASVKSVEDRLAAVEKVSLRSDADHDILIRINAQLDQVRATLASNKQERP